MSNFDSNETIQFTSSKPVYDFYVAGPYETAEQVESMERLEKVLNDRGMSVYRPRFAMDVNVSGPGGLRQSHRRNRQFPGRDREYGRQRCRCRLRARLRVCAW